MKFSPAFFIFLFFLFCSLAFVPAISAFGYGDNGIVSFGYDTDEGFISTLEDLDDTNVSSLTDGDVLTWDDSSGLWASEPSGAAGASSIIWRNDSTHTYIEATFPQNVTAGYLTVEGIKMDDDLNLGSNRIYNVGEIVMDAGSWIRGFASAAVVFADHIQARVDKVYDIGNVTNRFRNLFLSGNISTVGNVSASYFFGDGAFLTNLEVSGNFSGRGIPRWLNDSIDIYINSSYPQNINISGNATFGGGAIFRGATLADESIGYENIRFGVYAHTPRIIFDNGSMIGQIDYVGGHLRFIINDSATGWTNRAILRINGSGVRIGEAGRRRNLYLYGDLIGVNPAGGGANIDIDGGIDISGNFTGNQIYGEMWNYTSDGWAFAIPDSSIYYNITDISEAEDLNGFTHTLETQANGGSYLTAQVSGKYKIDARVSFSGGNNQLYGYGVSKNGIIQRDCYTRRSTSTTNTARGGAGCIISLSVGDKIGVQIEDEAGVTAGVTIYSINLNLVRIGN